MAEPSASDQTQPELQIPPNAVSSQTQSNHTPAEQNSLTPEGIDEELGIDVNDRSKIHEFLPALNDILRSGTSEENWGRFLQTIQEITDKVRTIVKIPVYNNINNNTRPKSNPEDPKWIQKLYKRNRRKAIRTVLGEEGRRCDIDKDVVETHFTRTSAHKPCDVAYENIQTPEDRNSVPTSRITPEEVAKRLSKCENTAPGEDRITCKHWKAVDPACTVLATAYNICLKYEDIPDTWKTSTTVLIYKKGDPNDISNWRPIAIMRTIYKLFAGVLARRLTTWLDDNAVLAPAQKGFLPYDGVFEHN
jgi:hypothetical protein